MSMYLKKKLFEEAYDSLYNLSSKDGYKYDSMLRILEKEVKEYGYEFYLKESSQKFKLRGLK